MKRRSINPVPWSLKLGFDQAVLIEGHRRQLVCSRQDAVDALRLNVYTTDFDELVKHWTSLMRRFGNSDGRFATSLLGVTRLFTPELLVMLEATAVD
jgi:hypothetical protein